MDSNNGKKKDSTWDLGDNGYKIDEYYTGATSKRGDGTTLYLRISGGMAAQIAALVQSRKFPYRTNADFVRDAIVHRLHWLAEQDGSDSPLLRAEMALSLAYMGTEQMEMLNNAYREFERGIRMAKDNQNWPQVKTLIDNARSVASTLKEPDDTKFRELADKTEKDFPAAWSALLDERYEVQ